jgi:small subunit ribosomal protein S1
MSDLVENDLFDAEARPADQSSPSTDAGTPPESAVTLPEDYADMGTLLEGDAGGFRTLRRNQILKGTVVGMDPEFVLVHVGTKSEGMIPREELTEAGEEPPELQYEQEIFVHVLEPDSPRGPILSLRRARREQAWVDMEEYVRSGTPISAIVVDHNRGGALLDVRGLRGFVPLSQLVSLGPPQPGGEDSDDTANRLGQLHGQRLTVKVLEAERSHNRLILSERAAADEVRARRRAELLADLQPGQIRRGTVRNVTSFGAFVDLGGADGLVHVSELSYEHIRDPKRVVQSGQEVDVFVLDVRPEDERISLSLKRATADPWESVTERYQPGEVVTTTITRLMKFGAFAQVEPGVEGLIHVTELAIETPKDPGQVVQPGQEVQAKIIHIDQEGRRLGLSLRQLEPVEISEDMTPEEWHATQEQQAQPAASAFEALSRIAETLPPEAEPSPEATAVDAGASPEIVEVAPPASAHPVVQEAIEEASPADEQALESQPSVAEEAVSISDSSPLSESETGVAAAEATAAMDLPVAVTAPDKQSHEIESPPDEEGQSSAVEKKRRTSRRKAGAEAPVAEKAVVEAAVEMEPEREASSAGTTEPSSVDVSAADPEAEAQPDALPESDNAVPQSV